MRRTLRILVPVALLLLLAAGYAAFHYAERSEALAAELAAAEATAATRAERLAAFARLAAADSLLYRGRASSALAAYRAIADDSTAAWLAGATDVRIAHAHRVRRMTQALDTLQVLSARGRDTRPAPLVAAGPRPVAPMPLVRSRPDQYDSLSFALQRAEMQIRTLEGRLRKNSGGNYLTFPSRQGNEVYYVGEVRDGKANGRGVALLSSGSRYVGEWRDNRKHGVGEFHWPDGAVYEGEYVDDQREGEGTYHFPDHGGTYVGGWEDDLRNGRGIYYDDEGEVVARGVWEDDELVERG